MSTDKWFTRKDHGDGIFEIGLNRAPVNALSTEFLLGTARLMDELAADQSVRAIVLSSPFKVFSAGLDLKEVKDFDRAQQDAIVDGLTAGFSALFMFPKPMVAAVTGAAIAGGLFYVVTTDFRVSGPRAKYGLAEVRVGADFPVAALEIARATLNPDALRRLMLSGQPMSASEAATAGFVDVIEDDETAVLDRAIAAARELADNPPNTYAAIKHQVRQPVIDQIAAANAEAANAPDRGWFTDETRMAMQRMLSGS